jgi:DNA-binding NtrC family response regulator
MKYPNYPILIIDDEIEALEAAETALLAQGIDNVQLCRDSRLVMAMLDEREAELVLLDLAMPHLRGEELLPQIVSAYAGLPVIVLTGLADTDRVVECMQGGAHDYLLKPMDGERLATTVRRAVEWRELCRENNRLSDGLLATALRCPEAFGEFSTNDPAMLTLFKYVEAIAPGDACVLISGETGVGKELLARAIHRLSGRTGEFVAVNVSGLDDAIFADTLFGHRKGGFTGAVEARAGLFQHAAAGTLLLDEIGDLSMASQIKLLRLLQEREYYQVGSDEVKTSTARVVASTLCNLSERVASGTFRQDLFFRLQGHHIHIPPLRDRLQTDLAALVDKFLTKAAGRLRKPRPTPPPKLLPLLQTYDFPGNVRELESMIDDAVSRHDRGVLSLGSLREYITGRPAGGHRASEVIARQSETLVFPPRLPSLREVAQALIDEALSRVNGNQSLAAQMLGISPQALNQRLKRRQAIRCPGPPKKT